MIRVAVIGTAGRNGLGSRLDIKTLYLMMLETRRIIEEEFGLDDSQVCLVSGGSSWSDHIAVRLFLSGTFGGLRLHLPTRWRKGFDDSKTGKAISYYHSIFSNAVKSNTIGEIQLALDKGGVGLEYQGFFERNDGIARESDYMIAFSFGEGKEPEKRSGTYYTWSRCKGVRRHVEIEKLKEKQK